MLLLLLYMAPLVALAAWWRGRPATLPAVAGSDEQEPVGALDLAREGLVASGAMRAPVAGALLLVVLLGGLAGGAAAAGGVLAGVATGACIGAVAWSRGSQLAERAVGDFRDGGTPESLRLLWDGAASASLACAALATGVLGGIAWFFADPAGALVLGAYASGAGAVALLLVVACGTAPVADATRQRVGVGTLLSATDSTTSALAAAVAGILLAACTPAESILWLGGLAAESETLRSDLLLLPVALSVVSTLLGLLVGPLLASLLARRGAGALPLAEPLQAVLWVPCLGMLVWSAGLAWTVAGAFLVGVGARQLLLLVERAAGRISMAARPRPEVLGVAVAVAAVVVAEGMGHGYGVALAAMGMTAAGIGAEAASLSRRLLAEGLGTVELDPSASGSPAADTATGIVTVLAVVFAAASASAHESLRHGLEAYPVAALSTPFLAALFVGGLLARRATQWTRAAREDSFGPDLAAARLAARVVFLASAVPSGLALLSGFSAVSGLLVGFTAAAGAGTAVLRGADGAAMSGGGRAAAPQMRVDRVVDGPAASSSGTPPAPGADAAALGAWGRAMALTALAAAPWMV